jgi:hypothetical protein
MHARPFGNYADKISAGATQVSIGTFPTRHEAARLKYRRVEIRPEL